MKPSKQTPSLFQSSLYPKTIAALLRRRLDTRAFRSGDNVLLPSMTLFFFLFLSSSTSPSSFSATSSSLTRLFHPCTTEDRPFRDSRYAKSFAIRFLGIRKERRRKTLKYYNTKRILDDNSIHLFYYSEFRERERVKTLLVILQTQDSLEHECKTNQRCSRWEVYEFSRLPKIQRKEIKEISSYFSSVKHFGARLSDTLKYKRTIDILTGEIWNTTLIESYAYRKLYTG